MTHSVRRLDLFVTEACNLGCPYCFAATEPRRNPTEEDTRRAIDWLVQSDAPKVHVTLWGGEPLLRRELLRRTVSYAKERASVAGKRVTFSMPTNASLLDAETMRWLEEEGVQIFLSIDGDERGQATRPLKRGGSSHGLVQIGMRNAIAGAGAPPAIRMTVSPDNAAHQGPSVRYFVDSGAHKLMIYAAFDQAWDESALAAFETGQREAAAFFVELVRACDSPAEVPSFEAWKPILRRLLDDVPARPREGPLRHCGAGTDLVALTVEGELAPCHRFVFYGRDRGEDVSVGDLERGVDASRVERLADLRIEDQEGVARCVDCELFDLCTYGCVAISYATSGELHRIPAAACRLMAAQIRVCREIHEALRDDPRYRVYLGKKADDEVRRAVETIASRARSLHDERGGDHERARAF